MFVLNETIMFCFLVGWRQEEEIIFNLLILSLPPGNLTESGNILIAKVKSSQAVVGVWLLCYLTVMMCELQ